MVKGYTVKDIQRAEFNLEPNKCRNCGSTTHASYNQYAKAMFCSLCGFTDDGSSVKKQLKEQGIKDFRTNQRMYREKLLRDIQKVKKVM